MSLRSIRPAAKGTGKTRWWWISGGASVYGIKPR
jgi:hypothetical protein